MERTTNAPEYEDLIGATGPGSVPNIDVTAQVMGRVLAWESRRRPAWSGGFARKSVLLGSVATFVLLLSVTAYAASEYFQIRDKAGKVKVQYVPEANGTITDPPYDKYEAQAQQLARSKPGELIVYYIKDKPGASGSEELSFAFKPKRLTAYEDFAAEVARTGGPLLPKTAFGYAFEYGTVFARFPTSDEDKRSDGYRQMLAELQGKASEAADGERLFTMTVPWNEPISIDGTYTSGGAHIGIHTIPMHEADMSVIQVVENTPNKLTIGDTTVVYVDATRSEVSYDYLTWYDESRDAYYRLTSYGDRTLTKDQYLKLAEEIIGQ